MSPNPIIASKIAYNKRGITVFRTAFVIEVALLNLSKQGIIWVKLIFLYQKGYKDWLIRKKIRKNFLDYTRRKMQLQSFVAPLSKSANVFNQYYQIINNKYISLNYLQRTITIFTFVMN